ncbi:hypothetical protein J6TS2_42790 [Heyndrickxia sporothermodurans]|nr:hypothetical protein J6TS2_42790 [Heyndrickxia sporothermodurans]
MNIREDYVSIYKTQSGREMSLKLYDAQLKKLDYSCKDVYVHTRFGRTHIIETGNLSGEPFLVFHGGNSTTAYNLLMYRVSFGGGVLAKLMCIAPEKVKKSVLIVPSGINNAFPISTVKMMIPLLKYKLTKKNM